MEILLCLLYAALCVAIFKVFRIPVNQWTLMTAVLAELAQSEFELASRFVAAPESNQRVGWLGRADLGV